MVRIGLLQRPCRCWHHTIQHFAMEVKATGLVINGRAEDCLDEVVGHVMLHFVGRFNSLRMTLPQCHPLFGKILQFCLGSNVATGGPIDSFTNKKSFNVSWHKLSGMSHLIMKTSKSLNIHRVQKMNTTLWRRAGKKPRLYNFYRFFKVFLAFKFFLRF